MIQRINPGRRYADAVIHQGCVYLVEVPQSTEADMTIQCHEVLAALEQSLRAAGSDKHQLLMATVYLTDMADYAAMNAVWEAWLPPAAAPVRACVQVAGLAQAGWRIEIAATAALA